MEISNFTEKLNKVDGNIYVVEEVVHPENGVYEAELWHDNVNLSTLSVYTGPKLTGERIESYALSTPSLMPWKRVIRVYTEASALYISYETEGDTVEADDINRTQTAVLSTQMALNQEITRAGGAEETLARRLTDEENRATGEEARLAQNLTAEIERATGEEARLARDLTAEIERATGEEASLAQDLTAERERATGEETRLARDLTAEIERATGEETRLAQDLTAERERATGEEARLARDLTAERERATGEETRLVQDLKVERERALRAETDLTQGLSDEADRAGAAEQVLSGEITAERTRAQEAESRLNQGLTAEESRAVQAEQKLEDTLRANKPVWDDKYTRNEMDNRLSLLETAIDWKETADTYEDLARMYPNPEDGWTVNVKDTDYTYRWDGTAWIAISANAIPKATRQVDGLLSKEDKALYDDASARKHLHGNKTVLDGITAALVSSWNSSANSLSGHTGDTAKHVTAAERALWNTVSGKAEAGHTHTDYVTGIKGNAEGSYRAGNVNLTPVNIGAAAAVHTHSYAGAASPGGAAAKAVCDAEGRNISAAYVKKGCTWNDLKGV